MNVYVDCKKNYSAFTLPRYGLVMPPINYLKVYASMPLLALNRLSIFENYDEKYRSIKTSYVNVWYRSIATTYEHIKMELIRNRTQLPTLLNMQWKLL